MLYNSNSKTMMSSLRTADNTLTNNTHASKSYFIIKESICIFQKYPNCTFRNNYVIVDILYDALYRTKSTIRIESEDKLQMTFVGKLIKPQPNTVIYSIDKYNDQTERSKNVKSYLSTVLYDSREQKNLDIMNFGRHNNDLSSDTFKKNHKTYVFSFVSTQ